MNEYLDALIGKYRNRGLLVDSNLLILYLVGKFDERRIPQFGRTKTFTARDYRLVRAFVEVFPTRITTPNILTEISNLARDIPEAMRRRFLQNLNASFELMTEEYVPSREGAALPIFARLGLTDAIIGKVAKQRYLVLTSDFPLSNYLASIDADVINFNHLRSFSALQ